MNSDELLAQMLADELHDATKLTPIEYGRLHNIKPQLVYYHIRQGKLKLEHCICGRKVLDVATTDAFFAAKSKSKSGSLPVEPEVAEEEEASGSDMDSGEQFGRSRRRPVV